MCTWCCQLRARRALSLLSRMSLNSVNALLALNWQCTYNFFPWQMPYISIVQFAFLHFCSNFCLTFALALNMPYKHHICLKKHSSAMFPICYLASFVPLKTFPSLQFFHYFHILSCLTPVTFHQPHKQRFLNENTLKKLKFGPVTPNCSKAKSGIVGYQNWLKCSWEIRLQNKLSWLLQINVYECWFKILQCLYV